MLAVFDASEELAPVKKMFVPLITISLLGLILNGLLQVARSYLLRGFPQA